MNTLVWSPAAWLEELRRLNANLEALRVELARLERAAEPVTDLRDMAADLLGWTVTR